MADYFFGEILGQPVGTAYARRRNLTDAGVHQVTQQGIAGNRTVGCASIVVSGGYETDEDYGHEIFYTGAGGQDPRTKAQVAHQDLERNDNAALVRSQETGLPVRVIRGAGRPGHDNEHAPTKDYRYDGLYKVINHYEHYPSDGYRRWMFHLVQLASDEAELYTPKENFDADNAAFERLGLGSGMLGTRLPRPTPSEPGRVDPFYSAPVELVLPAGKTDPGTKVVVSQRVVRETKITAAVKIMYDDTCQFCGTKVETKSGHYSEGAHIRPIGRPHHGPDTMSNILCLCPNHHAAFDKGGVFIEDDLTVHAVGGQSLGELTVHPEHDIDLNNVRYHRAHHGHAAESVG